MGCAGPGAALKREIINFKIKVMAQTKEKKLKIQFLVSPTAQYGLAYNAGDEAEIPEGQAREIVQNGDAFFVDASEAGVGGKTAPGSDNIAKLEADLKEKIAAAETREAEAQKALESAQALETEYKEKLAALDADAAKNPANMKVVDAENASDKAAAGGDKATDKNAAKAQTATDKGAANAETR